MTTIVTRTDKGSPLSIEEVDQNFINLKTDVESTQSNVTVANAKIQTISANLGSFQTYANATYGGGAYGNTQVAAYLPTYTGSLAQSSTLTTLDANLGVATANIVALFSNAGAQANSLTGANAAIVTANTAMKGYVDAVTTAWTANAGVQADAITGANAAIVTANTAMKSYADYQISSANTTMTSYVGNQVTSANTTMTSYVGNQVTTANTAMKGYVDTQVATKTTTSYVDTAVSTAVNNLINSAPGTLDTLGEIAANLATNADTVGAIVNTITSTNANVTAANARIVTLDANLGTATTNITTLFANAGTQSDLIQTLSANLGGHQTWANANFGTSNYSNVTTAAYLPVYGGSILALSITGVVGQDITLEPDGTGDVSLNADTIKIGDNNTDATITTRGTGNLLLRTHSGDATQGNITLVAQANGNIKIWPHGTGVVDIAKSAVIQGNVSANYLLGDGSLLTNLPVQAGTYSNTTTEAYLASATISTTGNITGSNLITAGNVYGGYVIGDGSLLTNLPVQAGTYSNTTTAAYLATGTIAVANITSVAGYFWSNGTTYGSSATAFNGNLAGSTLIDSTRGRVFANASPVSVADTTINGITQATALSFAPIYTNGQVNPPPIAASTAYGDTIVPTGTSQQVVGFVSQSNIALRTGAGAGSNQNLGTIGTVLNMAVTPVTANTMVNADRVRSAILSLDVNLSGKTWGTMSSTSQGGLTLNGATQQVNLLGSGSAAAVVGSTVGVGITPPINTTGTGYANVQYATGAFSFVSFQGAPSTARQANVVYARGFVPGVFSQSANLTVDYAVGFHTYSGWSGSGTIGTTSNPRLGRFALLNEDVNTTIQTVGNININSAYLNVNAPTAGIRSNAFTQFSGNVAFERNATAGVATNFAANLNTTVNGNLTVGSTYFARVSSWTVAALTAYAGLVGQIAAVTDGTGKNNGALAYWDVTNTRWSWIDTNLAVT